MKDLKKNFYPFFKKIAPIFIIFLIVSTFYWRFFLKHEAPIPGDFIVGVYYPWLDYKWGTTAGIPVKNPITTDVVSFTYPMQTLAMKLLKKGTPPLWNPYILAGSPLLANFQSAPFSPTSFVYFLFDNFNSWSIQVILQHLLAAIFTYVLLRYWRLSKMAATFGGILYTFSGYNLIFSEWNGHTLAAAFIPLVLFFEDRILEKKKFSDGFGLSVSLALQFFSGYTQTSVYTAVAMGILYFVRFKKEKEYFQKTLFLTFFCLLSLLISAVQIIPSLELIKNSQRDFEPHPYEWAFLPWKKTITFIAPDFFGNHVTHNYWGPQDYTSNTGFVGVIAVILSIIATKFLKTKKPILFLLTLTIVSLLLSFPTPISIFIWDKNILGMKANSAHRATVLFCVSISFLAAFGYDLVQKINFRFKISALFAPSILILSSLIFAFLLRKQTVFGISVFIVASKNLILPSFALILASLIILVKPKLKFLLFPLAFLEIFYFGWKFTPFSPKKYVYPQTPILNFLESQKKPFRVTGAKVIPSNIRMAYSLETPEGYDTFHPLNMSRFIAAINSGSTQSLPVGRYGIVDNDVAPILDLVNTKYYLALKSDLNIKRFDEKRFKKVFDDKSVIIFESRSALPRAFMAYDWEIEKDDIKTLDILLDKNFSFSKKIIVNSEAKNLSISNGSQNSVNYLDYSENESLISVETQKDGLLFVSDAFYPGWHAYIDGNETEIIKADVAFRTIALPKGKHIVKFIYNPNSFNLGVTISLISFILLFGSLLIYTMLK